jgi:putative peptide zinc metalloprotease protein
VRDTPCPRFRPDLVVRRVVEAGDAGYTIYDPARNSYFRQDAMTRFLCTLLDGKRTHDEVLEELGERYPQYGFDREFVDEALDSLKQQGFLEDAFNRNLLVQERAKAARKRLLSSESLKNVLSIQFASFNPMPLFKVIYPWTKVIWSKWWVLGVTLASIIAVVILWERRDEVVGNLFTIFTLEGSTWVGFAILWIVLFGIVVLHEFGHGLCNLHYGGESKQLGFLLMYFTPAMYCDVSDLYFIEKRWPRVAVALAGGYIELQIFALGTFIWALTPPDLLIHQIAYRVLLFSGITGIIFNYNPLIKWDGYYVMLGWLDIPEIRERSFAWMKAKAIGLITGKPQETEALTRRERRVFIIYGLLAIVYSVFFLWISVMLVRGLLVGSFQETGFVLFVLFLFLVTRGMLRNLVRTTRMLVLEHAGLIRKKWAMILAGVAVLIAVFVIPLPHSVKVHAVLAPNHPTPVRSPVDGRVAALLVREGVPVKTGTIVAVITSPALDADRAADLAAREEASVEARQAAIEYRESHHADVRGERARWAASEWAGKQAHLASPIDGIVLTRRAETLEGFEVEAGDSLITVGKVDSLRVVLMMSEREVGDLAVGREAGLRLRSDPGKTHHFPIDYIDLAPVGEPILGESAASLARGDRPPTWYRAEGIIPNKNGRLRPGMTGVVKVEAPPLNVAQRLGRIYARLVRADFWL